MPAEAVGRVTPWSLRQLVNAWIALSSALLVPFGPPRPVGALEAHALSAFWVAASGEAPPIPPPKPPKPPP
jgi:hypothetical protein